MEAASKLGQEAKPHVHSHPRGAPVSQGLAMLGGACANSLAVEDWSLMGPPWKRGTSFLCEKSALSPNIQH